MLVGSFSFVPVFINSNITFHQLLHFVLMNVNRFVGRVASKDLIEAFGEYLLVMFFGDVIALVVRV